MSSLLTTCLAALLLLLTASLGLRLPRPGEARLGTRLELRPLQIQTQGLPGLSGLPGLLSESQSGSVSGVVESLSQALSSFIHSVIDFVSSQFRQEIIYD